MRKLRIFIALIVILILGTVIVAWASSKRDYNTKAFLGELKKANNKFIVLNNKEKDILSVVPTDIAYSKDHILVYEYKDSNEMENDAYNIDSGGCRINNSSSTSVANVNWASDPHFYKKGRIIVRYIGYNTQIISMLEDILGKQFSGLTSQTLSKGTNNKN